jgi:hypothetical protein
MIYAEEKVDVEKIKRQHMKFMIVNLDRMKLLE